MTTRISIRPNAEEAKAFARIKGKTDAEKFRLMLWVTTNFAIDFPAVYKYMAGHKSIKSVNRNGRHVKKG